MAYKIDASEKPGIAIRRIAAEQVSKALEDIRRTDVSVGWQIHQVRRRCKRTRGAARLIRPGFEQFKAVNRRFRAIAQRVSEHRDARVIAELVTAVCSEEGIAGAVPHPAADWYWKRCELAEAHGAIVLRELEPDLASAAVDVEGWEVADIDVDAAIKGLGKTLSRAYDGFHNAGDKSSAHAYHDWRKYCTYHGLHVRLIRDVLPSGDSKRHKAFSKLGSLIGEEHDYSVLIGSLSSMPSFISRRAEVRELLAVTIKRRRDLRRLCQDTAHGMFDKSPKDFCERVAASWAAKIGLSA